MTEQMTDNLSYQKALNGLLRMHQLFVEGKRKSEEVRRLRDELDEPFLDLTPEENEVLEGLSVDLFDVEKIKKNEKRENSPEVLKLVHEAIAARDVGRLDHALELLRQAREYRPFSRISFLRASIWRLKGSKAATIILLKHAVDLDPDSLELRRTLSSLLDSIDPGAGVGRAAKRLAVSDRYIVARNTIMRLHHLRSELEGESWQVKAAEKDLDVQRPVLNEAERKRIEGLEHDLEFVRKTTAYALPTPMTEEAMKGLDSGSDAERRGDYDLALERLRKWEAYSPSPLVSFLRGKVWKEMGDYGMALLFMEHAVRLAPRDVNFQSVFLNTLKVVDLESAASLAVETLRTAGEHSPLIVVQAAQVIFDLSRDMPPEHAKQSYEMMMPILEAAVKYLDEEDAGQVHQTTDGMVDAVISLGLIILASCSEQLGDFKAAYDYYTRAIARNPIDGNIIAARAALPYGDRDKAAEDLEAAIGYGLPFVWPYVFLARHYMMKGEFEDCKRICERGLKQKPESRRIESELYEFLAMSQVSMKAPAANVRATFAKAIETDERNERAKENLAIFEAGFEAVTRRWKEASEESMRKVKFDEVGIGGLARIDKREAILS